MSILKTNNLQTLDASRTIEVSNIAEMNGGFSFRNKIVDGRFDFWYEGTSQTIDGYGSDTMWGNRHTGSSKTHTQQTLAHGVDLPAIDVPSAKYFSRTIVNSVAGSSNRVYKATPIEGVRTLAGKKATLSFYAKADATKNIAIEFIQNFGEAGSPSTPILGIESQLVALSTAWKRYEITVDIPDIDGKIISTDGRDQLILLFWFDAGSSWDSRAANLGQQSGTFDIACVQLEEGTVATPFEELPANIARELMERYYNPLDFSTGIWINGYASSATTSIGTTIKITQMRTYTPTITHTVGSQINTSSTQLSTISLGSNGLLSLIHGAWATAGVSRIVVNTLRLDARL